MAMADLMILLVLMGVLKATTEAMMMTTGLVVFPTACVTGLTLVDPAFSNASYDLLLLFAFVAAFDLIIDSTYTSKNDHGAERWEKHERSKNEGKGP